MAKDDIFFGISHDGIHEFIRFNIPKNRFISNKKENKWIASAAIDDKKNIDDFDAGIFLLPSSNLIIKIKKKSSIHSR